MQIKKQKQKENVKHCRASDKHTLFPVHYLTTDIKKFIYCSTSLYRRFKKEKLYGMETFVNCLFEMSCSRYTIIKKTFIIRSVENNICTVSRTMGIEVQASSVLMISSLNN